MLSDRDRLRLLSIGSVSSSLYKWMNGRAFIKNPRGSSQVRLLTSLIVLSTNLNLRRLREMSLMARCKKLTIRVLTITLSNLKLSFGVVRVKIIPSGGG